MKTITLIGMMGVGKTTVGKQLADVLGVEFLDLDFKIVENEKTSISEIFEKKGECYFRQLESEILQKNFKKENMIISLGGGTFQNKNSQQLLLDNSNVIYLKADAVMLLDRLKNDDARPLLKDITAEKFDILIKNRQKNYEKAHYIIDADNKTVQDIIQEIIEVVK